MSVNNDSAHKSKKHLPRRVPGLSMLAIGMIAGLLIWAKLRLVTDFPRIVQADPQQSQADAPGPDEVDSATTESGRAPPQTDGDE